MLSGADVTDIYAGKDITCVIDLKDEMYGAHGLEAGLSYEFIRRFAEDNKCNLKVIAATKNENYIDSLKNEKVEFGVDHECLKEFDKLKEKV